MDLSNPSQRRQSPGEFAGVEVSLTLRVLDEQMLWTAARDRLFSFGLSIGEVEECIGPHEDVIRSDCVIALLLPLTMPGCTVCKACAVKTMMRDTAAAVVM